MVIDPMLINSGLINLGLINPGIIDSGMINAGIAGHGQIATRALRRMSRTQPDATAGLVTSVFERMVTGRRVPVCAVTRTEKVHDCEILAIAVSPLQINPLPVATVADKPVMPARNRAWPSSTDRAAEIRRSEIERRTRGRAATVR